MTEYSNPYSQSDSATYSDPVLTTTETDGQAAYYGTTSDAPQYGASEVDRPLPGGSDYPAAGTSGDGDASMKDKASQSAEAGKQAAGEVAQTAADKAKDVAAETKQQARNVVGQAQDQLRQQTSTQHKNLVNNLRSLGDELSSMSQGSEQSGYATDLVGQAADRAHGAASWLDSKEPNELVDEVRRFARQKPGAFILGALVAGVVAGRLTRGVVAVHKDDSDDSDKLTDSFAGTDPVTAGYGTAGYDAGYAAPQSGYATGGYESTPGGGYSSAGMGTAGYETTGYAGGVAGSAPVGGIEP